MLRTVGLPIPSELARLWLVIIIREPIALDIIRAEHNHFFGRMVKIVVDTELFVVAADAELHSDLEQLLLQNGSQQQNIWGANVYFEGPILIEFTSLINIRPAQGNKSMEVKDELIRQQMEAIVLKLMPQSKNL